MSIEQRHQTVLNSVLPIPAAAPLQSAWKQRGDQTNLAGFVTLDQAGTLVLEQSLDGVTIHVTTTTAIVANTPLYPTNALVAPYYRVRVTAAADAAAAAFIEARYKLE